jgi:hypothetical protein
MVYIVIVAPASTLPTSVDAVVAEEDTFLVLSTDPEPKETHERPERLLARAREVEPEIPGTILVRGDSPLRFLAIVHDLNEDPSWKEEWVGSALREIFLKVEELELESIALPILGTIHGSLEPRRFAELLRQALHHTSLTHLTTIRLITPQASATEISDALSEFHCEIRR